MIRRALRWSFVSRRTGRVSVVAWPNAPLWIWIAAAVAGRLLPLHGSVDRGVALVGAIALVVWSVGELGWGVNPFRRLLGLVVLIGTVHALFG